MQKNWIDRNLETRRALSYHNKIHYSKLSQIATSGIPMGTKMPQIIKHNEARIVEANTRKFRAEKKKTAKFQEFEKNMAITRENQILLSKLVDISNGKQLRVTGPSQVKKQYKRSSTSQNRAGFRPQTLNMVFRKQETERIERENHAFAVRLFERKPAVMKQIQDREYQQNMKYRKQIGKMQMLQVSNNPLNRSNMGSRKAHTRGSQRMTQGRLENMNSQMTDGDRSMNMSNQQIMQPSSHFLDMNRSSSVPKSQQEDVQVKAELTTNPDNSNIGGQQQNSVNYAPEEQKEQTSNPAVIETSEIKPKSQQQKQK